MMEATEKIAVIGLGYVGLPLAVALARHYETLGYDVDPRRVEELRRGYDRTGEVEPGTLGTSGLKISSDPQDLAGRSFYIVTVPTPIDEHKNPDLSAVIKASETVGRYLSPGAVVVYESTVYPGVTEEICVPILERVSGLAWGRHFKMGYSPERINPGDKVHALEKVVKVVSGQDEETLERVATVYAQVVEAGVHRAPSIKVAEAAKVIENIQRDLNIALMNELALIFDRLGIHSKDVLAAAGTKWNFLPFKPGLVGGHCIGVDPYYLTRKAQEVGYLPQVILAGRRVNDGMGPFVAQKMIKLLIQAGVAVKGARVGVLGLTFKENVPDIRNSRIPDILKELKEFGIEVKVHDPLVHAEEAEREYGLHLVPREKLAGLDGLILAVAHRAYLEQPLDQLLAGLRPGGVVIDVKSVLNPQAVAAYGLYWSL